MDADLRIGFLGAGKMATALAAGFVRTGLVTKEQIMGGDLEESARAAFAAATGAKTTSLNAEVVQFANVVFLAVKPGQVLEVLRKVANFVAEHHLIISIAAGVPLAKLTGELFDGVRLVRVMPNTPALIGASATAYALGEDCTEADAQLVQRFFSSVGVAFSVKEHLLDAVTGLSGSGPAYVCLMIEALSDGGVAAGLPRDVATRLAAQTLLGTARMVLETGQHPGVLKDMVTSAGGTTIEGLHELEKAGLRAGLISAVRAAAEKSRKLGQG